MTKSKIVVEFFVPTTSYARIGDATKEIFDVVKTHRGELLRTTVSGPYEENHGHDERRLDEQHGNRDENSRQVEARQAFGDKPGGSSEQKPQPGKSEPDATGTDDGGEPKRKRGRPPGSKKGTGTAPEGRDGGEGAEHSSGSEKSRGNEPERTREGAGKGADEGEGRQRGDPGSRDDQRRDREAPRLKNVSVEIEDDEDWGSGDETEDDDWGASPIPAEDLDEGWHAKAPGNLWPTALMPKGLTAENITRQNVQALMGEHFRSHGGKSKKATYAVLVDNFQVEDAGKLPEEDFWKAARLLIKDTMRYKYGVKKQIKE